MEIQLRPVFDREEALGLCTQLDVFAAQHLAEFGSEPAADGLCRAFVERHFESPEFLLHLAESSGGMAGACLIGPMEDPLSAERYAFISILHVERDFRHQGLARALVFDAKRILAERGLSRLAARAGHNDDALISMGERWGFLRHWELLLHEGD